MRRSALVWLLLLAGCSRASPEDAGFPQWTKAQIESLRQAVAKAPEDALPLLDTRALDEAAGGWDSGKTNRAATELALKLANAHLHGCAAPAERIAWFVDDAGDGRDSNQQLVTALANGDSLDSYFAAMKPDHPEYAALREAYARETDPARRTKLARNLERWRWMPRSLGQDYVLVNATAFEVGLWRGGQRVKTWSAVIGKPSTATPSFNATITHVILNPWWEVPASIVAENGGGMGRGYVRTNGRYRQPPGPRNALGQMKVVMPNSYNIYLHDTPSRGLFSHTTRAYSHGCVRVSDAVGFAETLLEGSMRRDKIDEVLGNEPEDSPAARRQPASLMSRGPQSKPPIRTVTVPLQASLPVYIAYFTAGTRGDGQFRFEGDVYGRDAAIGDPSNPHRQCGAGQSGVLLYTVQGETPA